MVSALTGDALNRVVNILYLSLLALLFLTDYIIAHSVPVGNSTPSSVATATSKTL